jgi:hypothetical protein
VLLTKIDQYSADINHSLQALSNPASQHNETALSVATFKPFSSDLLPQVERIIELCDSENVENILSELLREIQVLDSRVANEPNGSGWDFLNLPANIDVCIDPLALIQARVDKLFPFARGETEKISLDIDFETLNRKLNILNFRPESERAKLYVRAEKRILERNRTL